ncbi:hypothetical protein ACFORH_04570 [Amycolatopsis roodepoortensis]|uniref:Uncharacterized protein n=1 Tax=Amycolatopsis roodepoortensis TaxID=700274 RepID=A0ABR9L6U8_9PSEU|nr:hypothetical protein [Amycolatopsis roodepoortensis]MBE1576277.1 hypothetical protein [Amycolatopsis roodepoortensis]
MSSTGFPARPAACFLSADSAVLLTRGGVLYKGESGVADHNAIRASRDK